MYWLFTRLAGWNRLTARYGVKAEPPGPRLTRQTLKVGPVRWRLCVTMILAEQGLYLHPRPALGAVLGGPRPLIIPWGDFKRPRNGHLYLGWKAVEMSIGEPEMAAVTFPLALYEQLRTRIFPAAGGQ